MDNHWCYSEVCNLLLSYRLNLRHCKGYYWVDHQRNNQDMMYQELDGKCYKWAVRCKNPKLTTDINLKKKTINCILKYIWYQVQALPAFLFVLQTSPVSTEHGIILSENAHAGKDPQFNSVCWQEGWDTTLTSLPIRLHIAPRLSGKGWDNGHSGAAVKNVKATVLYIYR